MNKKKTIILLVIGILVVTISSIGVTYSYMKNKTSGNKETEIGINNCARITLKDNSILNLENMYPMEEEMGLLTEPYEFTVSSTCEEYIGFNLYLTTLSDNEIKDKDIRYAVTDVDDNVLITDLLINKEEATDLSEEEIKELEQGLDNKRNKTYKVFNNNLYIKEEKTYKLHLWLDENANNDTMKQSFKIKVSIKGYDWDGTIANYLITNRNDTLLYHNGTIKDMDENIIDAEDYSYRYSGANYKIKNDYKQKYNEVYNTLIKYYCGDKSQSFNLNCTNNNKYFYLDYQIGERYNNVYNVIKKAIADGYIESNINNYVCFGGDCSNDPTNDNYANLYRIIGIFPTEETKNETNKEYQLKIIKADYATADELGGVGVGAYYGLHNSDWRYSGGYNENPTKLVGYYWNKQQNNSGDYTNDWSKSNLQEKNLNDYYLNTYLKSKVDSEKWLGMIEEHNWTTAGNITANIYKQNAKTVYENEIIHPEVGTALPSAVKTYPANIGLMYISDYMYGASKEFWTTMISENNNPVLENKDLYVNSVPVNNWLYMGIQEWVITRLSITSNNSIYVGYLGGLNDFNVRGEHAHSMARPCFYLKTDVKISSGLGTPENPYVIDT